MKREKGLAYCGLACCVCGQNETCAGCRSDGCTGREWCKNRGCCIEKGIAGCWECADFPCGAGLLAKLRPRAFSGFAAEFGEAVLLDALEANEKAGIIYHYENQLVGDYDVPETADGVRRLLLRGRNL